MFSRLIIEVSNNMPCVVIQFQLRNNVEQRAILLVGAHATALNKLNSS